jgi:hypothetical protein
MGYSHDGRLAIDAGTSPGDFRRPLPVGRGGSRRVRPSADWVRASERGVSARSAFLHFLSILVTGAVFIVGYLARWRHTPFAIVVMYAVLATLCFVETVDFEAFGGGATRFIPMTIEYIAYIGFSTYLFRSSEMRRRFQRAANARAGATRRE